jgi:hypothetical protein
MERGIGGIRAAARAAFKIEGETEETELNEERAGGMELKNESGEKTECMRMG